MLFYEASESKIEPDHLKSDFFLLKFEKMFLKSKAVLKYNLSNLKILGNPKF